MLKAKINFEVYLNNISIDTLKKDYDQFKSKYFNEISEILIKLTHKILGLPIGIATILFTISKIEDNNTKFLILILIAIIITSIYLGILLKVNFDDLKYLSKIHLNDYNYLANNNFFKKYPDELSTFNEIKNRIDNKISFLTLISRSYFWVLGISNITITWLILEKLYLPFNDIFIITVILLLTLAVIYRSILKNL